MFKLSQLYALGTPAINDISWRLGPEWFPELGGIWQESTELYEELQAEKRLTLHEVIYDSADGYRFNAITAVKFDGVPVFLMQQAGRSGRDHQRRFITNKTSYAELVKYLFAKLTLDVEDSYFDPEEPVYEESILHMCGKDYGEELGIKSQPRRRDVMVIANSKGICPNLPQDQYLVFLKKDTPDLPLFIRRHDFVMEKVRQVTDAELSAENERILPSNLEEQIDRVYLFKAAPNVKNEEVLSV